MNHIKFYTILCIFISTSLTALENAVILSGNANPALVEQVAQHLNINVSSAIVSKFNDGEINIRINDNVRNKHAYIIQSTCAAENSTINDTVMELYLMIRALKRASISSVTAVIPYFGYARQDRKNEPRVPISAADVALLLETAGADRIVSVDLHCGQIQGFFRDIPVDNLYASTVFAPYFAVKKLFQPVVISPDAGGVTRAKQFLFKLKEYNIDAGLAMIIEQREKAGVIEQMNLVGNVQGSDVVIVDDICDTAGTLVKAAEILKQNGARRVYAAITHPVFSPPALKRIDESPIDEMVISDTINLELGAPEKITQVSIAPLIAEALRRVHNGETVSKLF